MSTEYVDAMCIKVLILRLRRIVEDSHNSTPTEIIRGEICKIVNKKCAGCGERMRLHDIDYGNQDLCWRCESYLRRGEEIIGVTNDET
jgi:hypothetical protein